MSLVIGIDFDNTIACYDDVFCNVAQKLELFNNDSYLSKSQVKQYLLNQKGGDLNWQKLQGKVYGKYMHFASIFPGFIEFLYLCRLKGHRLFIVSHKSEYGHFDEERISLREAALQWMRQTGIEGNDELQLNKEDIFFASTRELKIEKIRELKCDYFIDDLVEVLDEQLFPDDTKQILFDPHRQHSSTDRRLSFNSWRQIKKTLLGDWSELEVVKVVKKTFPSIDIKTSELIKGRGNSQIYQLNTDTNNCYALKLYPDRQLDSRKRLETEFSACRYLFEAGFPVMQAQDKNEQLNWAVYEWISGQSIKPTQDRFIDEAITFVSALYNKSQQSVNRSDFNKASEACLCGKVIIEQINYRLQCLSKATSIELSNYINKEFIPVFDSFTEQVKTRLDELFTTELPTGLQILSPSDFGSHNAIRDESGEIIFIDLEYFGWDDPVKLVSDFYWHPGMNLSMEMKDKWIHCTNEIFKADPTYVIRLSAYLPLYALRWCLIMLNEFLPERLVNRLNASNKNESNIKDILAHQLNKSKTLLNQVIEEIPNYGSTLQIS